MAVYRIQESDSDDFKRYWYLNGSLKEDGEALWLKPNGSYFKGSWTQAQEMTHEEAQRALSILNNNFRRRGGHPAYMHDYLPGW